MLPPETCLKKNLQMPELLNIYRILLDHYGPRHWWPADTPFEVAIGAILTQNTNWRNVEKALARLREKDLLSVEALLALDTPALEELIRPSGYFRQKARRLQGFCAHLQEHHRGRLERLLAQDLEPAREELLGLHGIGPETADSILLYAGGHLSFVIDAYTLRLFSRLGLLAETTPYPQARNFFMEHLPPETALYNEYHALIVIHGNETCRPRPRCPCCPCRAICPWPDS